jgi:quercetin dioxygenase-like cupin family protein
MKTRKLLIVSTLTIAFSVVAPVVVVMAVAQQAGIKRTLLGSIDFPAGFTTVTGIAEISAGNCSGRHTHPGAESGYVMEGELILKIDGKPDQTFKVGQWFENPAYQVHDACSMSGVKVLSTYVVEKGKLLASPAP